MVWLTQMIAVARVEARILRRSWPLRICALLLLAGWLLLFPVILSEPVRRWLAVARQVFPPRVDWLMSAVPSSFPLLSFLVPGIAVAVLAALCAVEAFGREGREDTARAAWVRPAGNAAHVAGKALAACAPPLLFAVACALPAFLANIVVPDAPVRWSAWLIYPLLITLPAAVFAAGAAAALVTVTRSRLVALAAPIGLVALALLLRSRLGGGLLDLPALRVPLLSSEVTGFAWPSLLLLQRGLWLLLGLAGFTAAAAAHPRIPGRRRARTIAAVATLLLLVVAAGLGGLHEAARRRGPALRDRMRALNDALKSEHRPLVDACDLRLRHEGARIDCDAALLLRNPHDAPLDRFVLRLNPGLAVSGYRWRGAAAAPERDGHILVVVPDAPLAAGDCDTLFLRYEGTIDPEACFPGFDESDRASTWSARGPVRSIGRRFAWLGGEYALLVPGSLWYPVAARGFVPSDPVARDAQFTRFRLEVETAPGLAAVSQGPRERIARGRFRFKPAEPLCGLTLAVGRYESREIAVDGVTYAAHTIAGHDWFAPWTDALGDSLPAVVRAVRDRVTAAWRLDYPFSRLDLLEVPVQFRPVVGGLATAVTPCQQPGMLLLPERCATAGMAELAWIKRIERGRQTPRRYTTRRERQAFQMQVFLESLLSNDPATEPSHLSWTRAGFVDAPRWPAVGRALESFLAGTGSYSSREKAGLASVEEVNLALREQSLAAILADPSMRDVAPGVLDCKGERLVAAIEAEAGAEAFGDFVERYLGPRRFRRIPADSLIAAMRDALGVELAGRLEAWYRDARLPLLEILEGDTRQVVAGGRERHAVRFVLTNLGETEGVFEYRAVVFRDASRHFLDDTAWRNAAIGPRETREFGLLLEKRPRRIDFRLPCWANVPPWRNLALTEAEEGEPAALLDGSRRLSYREASPPPGTIVVDDLDPGFAVSEERPGFLAALFRDGGEEGMPPTPGRHWWNARPARWTHLLDSGAVGSGGLRTICARQSGEGRSGVSWTADLPESGLYDVYARVELPLILTGKGALFDPEATARQRYRVLHEGGVAAVAPLLAYPSDRRESSTWVHLGAWRFADGPARVELSDESDGAVVVADAVKWVRR